MIVSDLAHASATRERIENWLIILPTPTELIFKQYVTYRLITIKIIIAIAL